MKIYLIRECNSYGKREIVATTTNKKRALEWLKTLNIEDRARYRTEQREFTYRPEEFLNKKKVTLFSYFSKKTTDYYVVDEWETI